MENKRKVQTEEAQQYSADSDIIHMETSAKTAANVGALFIAIGESMSWFWYFILFCFALSNFFFLMKWYRADQNVRHDCKLCPSLLLFEIPWMLYYHFTEFFLFY